jgi:RHS repeat-associated protein
MYTSPTASQAALCASSLPGVTIVEVGIWSPPGYSQPFVFCYADITTSFSYNYTMTVGGPTPVLESVVLPNGQAWIFGYTENIANCRVATNIGDLTHITLPAGGTIDYTYECIQPWNWSTSDLYQTAVISRTVNANDGTGAHTWTYQYVNNGGTSVATITDPLSNQTVNTLNPAATSTTATREIQVYSGNASAGSLLRTNTRVYPSQYGSWHHFPLYESSETTTLENGLSTQTSYSYCCDFTFGPTILTSTGSTPGSASYGKQTDAKVYDYSTGTGPLLRETATSYLFQSNSNYLNPGFFGLVSSKTVLDASGDQLAQTTYAYDQSSRVTSGIASISGAQMTSPIFSVFGHQTSQTAWLSGGTSPQSTMSYYDTGEGYQSTDPLGHTTSTFYCSGTTTTLPCSSSTYLGALPTVVTNALGQQSSFTYRTDTGQKLTVTGPNSQTTTYSYTNPSTGVNDPLNRLTSIVFPDVYPGTSTHGETDLQYNDTGNIGVTVSEKITPAVSKVTQVIVDGLGRTQQTILQSDPGGPTYTRTAYDALGRKSQVWNPTRCNPMTQSSCPSESTWGITSYSYDAIDRQIMEVPPDGTSTANRITTSYSGNTATNTDQAGVAYTDTSDALGRLTQVSEVNMGWLTKYTYNATDNLICAEQHGNSTSGTGCAAPDTLGNPSATAFTPTTNPWRVRRFWYDSLSRLTEADNPETGKITYGYNADSVLTSKTDNRGQVIGYVPDALHRVTSKSYNGTFAATYTYDATGTNNYGIGRRTGMTDASGTTAWTYDQVGQETSETQTMAGVATPKSVTTTYALDGSPLTITYPSGNVVSYAPGGAGMTLSASDPSNNYATNLSYAPPGELASGTFGSTTTGFAGIVESSTFNSRLQPIQISALNGTTALLNLSYNFGFGTNDNGNVQQIVNGKNSARNQSFGYDGVNRLTSAQSGTWGGSFIYDAWGNLYQVNALAGLASPQSLQQPAPGGLNQLPSFSYDAAGDMTSDASTAYTFDTESRISAAGSTSYLYDGDGNRAAKTGSTLYWGHGLAESNASGTLTSEYIFVGGRRLARRDVSTGNVYYYLSDHLGSSNVVTNNLGVIQNESDFYPFGGENQITDNLSNQKFKFTGKERDNESGLDYFGARYYGSSMGRFMSPDPVKITPGRMANPQQLNLYSYVANNPLRFIDPDGETLQISGNVDDAQKQLCVLIGGDCSRISYNGDTHTITVNLTGIDLSQNEGASLLNDVVGSKNDYSLDLGSSMLTAGGLRSVTNDDPVNLDNTADWRYGKGKKATDRPPAGVDDAIGIDPNSRQFRDSHGNVVPLSSVIFHELAEAFAKVDGGQQYVNRDGSPGAHDAAVQRELTLRAQRPNMKLEGRAGDQLIRDPKPPKP